VFVPLMPILWNFVEKRGYKVRPTDKIIIGFVLTAISMGIMAIAGYQCDSYEDKLVKRPEKAITKLVFDDASKVSILAVQEKDDSKKKDKDKKDKPKPQVEFTNGQQVTVTVVVKSTYEMEVRPILNKSCVRCHGKEGTPSAGLDLRTLAGIMKGGTSG